MRRRANAVMNLEEVKKRVTDHSLVTGLRKLLEAKDCFVRARLIK